MARPDSIVRDGVTFVKIDVGGHELNVLRGAQGVIERCQPVFLVEAEERHRVGATASIFDFFRDRNYDGFFLRGRHIVAVDEFDSGADQDETALLSDGGRQDNFFFFPASCDGQGMLAGA